MAGALSSAKRQENHVTRTHAERREDAERRMLRAAVELLAKRGFAELTLNEVGEAAGYSRALPAHYFGTKEQMIGVLAHYIANNFNSALRIDHERLGLVAIISVCTAYFHHAAEDPLSMRALLIMATEAMRNGAVAPTIVDVNANSISSFAASIEAGKSSGEIRSDIDAGTMAALIVGQLRGTIALWLTETKRLDIRRLQEAFLSNLRNGLVPL